MEYFESAPVNNYVGEPTWPANQMKKPLLQIQSIATITRVVGKAGSNFHSHKFIWKLATAALFLKKKIRTSDAITFF